VVVELYFVYIVCGECRVCGYPVQTTYHFTYCQMMLVVLLQKLKLD